MPILEIVAINGVGLMPHPILTHNCDVMGSNPTYFYGLDTLKHLSAFNRGSCYEKPTCLPPIHLGTDVAYLLSMHLKRMHKSTLERVFSQRS